VYLESGCKVPARDLTPGYGKHIVPRRGSFIVPASRCEKGTISLPFGSLMLPIPCGINMLPHSMQVGVAAGRSSLSTKCQARYEIAKTATYSAGKQYEGVVR